MAINKLFAGNVGNPSNSKGSDVAGSVNALINLSNLTYYPQTVEDNTNKILWRNTASKHYVINEKKSGGYLLFGFVNNSTTTTDSLAVTNSETTRYRLAEVLNSVWAGLYKHTNSGTSGTWTNPTTSGAFANIIPAYTSGRALKYWRADQNGSYIEFQANPKNGKLNIALYSGASSASSAIISVNGTLALTVAPTASTSNTIKIYDIPCNSYADTETVTVRLTHAGTNGQAISVIGINFFTLSDWDGSEYDSFAYYRNSTFSDYLTQSSANDFVIREYISNIYGVSYHGGETNISSLFYDKSQPLSLNVNEFVALKTLKLKSSADVSWSSVGGGSVSIASEYGFSASGVAHIGQMSGLIEAEEIYTCMFGANEAFTLVSHPVKIDLTTKVNGSRNATGRTNFIQMKNPVTGQTINARFSIYDDTENSYGGPHIWKVVGSYNKLYYGPCINGRQTFTDLGFSVQYEFE